MRPCQPASSPSAAPTGCRSGPHPKSDANSRRSRAVEDHAQQSSRCASAAERADRRAAARRGRPRAVVVARRARRRVVRHEDVGVRERNHVEQARRRDRDGEPECALEQQPEPVAGDLAEHAEQPEVGEARAELPARVAAVDARALAPLRAPRRLARRVRAELVRTRRRTRPPTRAERRRPPRRRRPRRARPRLRAAPPSFPRALGSIKIE